METEISKANFNRAVRKWAGLEEHSWYLATFFSVQEAERTAVGSETGRIWLWDDESTVARCLEIVWQLAGKWQARRGPKPVNRSAFDEAVVPGVRELARRLNRSGVRDLYGIGSLTWPEYSKVATAVQKGVERISSVKKTQEVSPVIGSKVLHHFFPSVVPVYDLKMVSRKALRVDRFREFVRLKNNRWISGRYEVGSPLEEYDRYFGFCAQQIYDTERNVLSALRGSLANSCRALAPCALYERKRSILWRLDAKVAEYCLIGAGLR